MCVCVCVCVCVRARARVYIYVYVFVCDICEQIVNLWYVLTRFQTVSDLRVNLAKSSILPIGYLDDIQMLAGVLGCEVDAFPTAYLGLPLGAKFSEKAIWTQLSRSLRKDFLDESLCTFQKGGD